MVLTGRVGKIKYYLYEKLLKGIIKKRIDIQYSFKSLTGEHQKEYMVCLVQEKLIVKILKDCFNLDVDTTLIAMNIKKEWLLKKGGIKK